MGTSSSAGRPWSSRPGSVAQNNALQLEFACKRLWEYVRTQGVSRWRDQTASLPREASEKYAKWNMMKADLKAEFNTRAKELCEGASTRDSLPLSGEKLQKPSKSKHIRPLVHWVIALLFH